jgi:hypothetical protein
LNRNQPAKSISIHRARHLPEDESGAGSPMVFKN